MLVIVIAGTEGAAAREVAELQQRLEDEPAARTLHEAADNAWTLGELLGELLEVPEDEDIEGSAVAARLWSGDLP